MTNVTELVVINSFDCEIARIPIYADADGMVNLNDIRNGSNRELVGALSMLSVGDTVKIAQKGAP